MNCPRCYVLAAFDHNSNYYYHTCGWKRVVPPPDDEEIEPRKPLAVVLIEDTPNTNIEPQKRKMKQSRLWGFETRVQYLERLSLTEEDIFLDETDREYWNKEVENEDGEIELETIYVPGRFKHQKNKQVYPTL